MSKSLVFKSERRKIIFPSSYLLFMAIFESAVTLLSLKQLLRSLYHDVMKIQISLAEFSGHRKLVLSWK